jgi:DNA-binding protein YbaB
LNSYDRLHLFVNEIEGNLHRKQAVTASFAEATHRVDIPGGYGAVTVDGNGRLRSVELARDVAFVTTGRRLGAALVDAINQAERTAAADRERRIADTTKELPPAEWLVS